MKPQGYISPQEVRQALKQIYRNDPNLRAPELPDRNSFCVFLCIEKLAAIRPAIGISEQSAKNFYPQNRFFVVLAKDAVWRSQLCMTPQTQNPARINAACDSVLNFEVQCSRHSRTRIDSARSNSHRSDEDFCDERHRIVVARGGDHCRKR
jgi:hypothetical protein